MDKLCEVMSIYTNDGAVKIFPITVPIMGPHAPSFFQAPPKEELSDPVTVGEILPVHYSISRLEHLKEKIQSVDQVEPGWYSLIHTAEELSLFPSSETLITPTHLEALWRRAGVVPYPHQIETARKVLFDMGARAILADEVGLGKTIEAGIVMKELLLRDMARKILILTPASLVWQWYQEMKEKFNLAFAMQRSEYDWERTDQLIASLDTAKREPHRTIIENLHFDVLVVDEAHKLKNDKTQIYSFVTSINRTFTLLLTATPVQNDLKELYNLINLVRPGQLGTYRQFKREFVADLRLPKQTDKLKHLLSEVLVRNRRSENTITLTKRHVHPVPVELSSSERELYEGVSRFVKDEYFRAQGRVANMLPLLTLQREVCSSPIAAAVTIEKILNRSKDLPTHKSLQSLLDLALTIEQNSKASLLEQLVRDIGAQVIVFTEYRATQQYLKWRLQQGGFNVFTFDGSLSASRKEWIRELFRQQGDILISTESGGEGLNFQFCSHMINYDLPWNPMRLEQRIGRVHRLGQTQDVHVYNLATRHTIEEHILYLLSEKINMFEMIIGELDAILTHLKLGKSFERELVDILVGSRSSQEVRDRLDRFADVIINARGDAMGESLKGRLSLW